MARDEQPQSTTPCRDFPGLMLDADDRDIPPGAAPVQENFASEEAGLLKSALRYRLVTFDDNYQTGAWG